MKRKVDLPQLIKSAIEEGKQAGLPINYLADRVRINTKQSRDPSRSSNGGEYDFWLVIKPNGHATKYAAACSCDFWQPGEGWITLNEPYEKVVRAVRAA